MSKIPYADPGASGVTEEGKKAGTHKAFLVAFFVSWAITSLLAAGVALIDYTILKDTSDRALWIHIFADALGVAGLLGICVFGLTYVASRGAFDMLSYSVQLLFLNIFRPKYRKEKFPKTFYDYKVLKDDAERKPLYAMLIPASLYFICGVILTIVYNTI